jgi:hypothetical protein
VRQYRNDVSLRRLSVTVTNAGDRTLTISGVRLAAPGFSRLPMVDPEVELPPGDRVDLPVAYGDVSCGPPDTAPDRAELVVDGGLCWWSSRVDGGLLQRMRDKDCAQQAVAQAVTLRLGAFARRGARL